MSKKDEFKEFVGRTPNLIKYVKDGSMTWQKFYELWDLYGEENSIWDQYKEQAEKIEEFSLGKIISSIKNINVENVRKNIEAIQKAIGLFQDLTKKEPTKEAYQPRPIYRKFED
jgi:hypothetical protein